MRKLAALSLPALFSLLALPAIGWADSVTTFSTGGYIVPETITPIPTGFGTVGGNYFVPDAEADTLFVMPVNGGPPTAFATIPGSLTQGLFAPSGYGSLSGSFLVVGNGQAVSVSASGTVTTQNFSYDTLAATVAPTNFGSYGGKILLGNVEANGVADILVLNPNGTTSVLATLGVQNSVGSPATFSLGFAPSTFGQYAGDLIVTDGFSGKIYVVTPSGQVILFATLPTPTVTSQTTGLREFAFAPAGYGAYGGDLFVSVSGSQQGGGSVGSLDVVNSSGVEVADLLQGTNSSPLDPRGLYFTGSNQLLLADADPGILSVTPSALVATTPEPSTWALLLTGTLGLSLVTMRARKRDSGMML
jgi:hypothetical protein